MSVESTELERSALERKDRDELQTIAEAMGGSPGARARKAEIVDLILDLAGVTNGTPSGSSEDAGAPSATTGVEPEAAADARSPVKTREGSSKDEPTAQDSADDKADEAAGDDNDDKADEAETSEGSDQDNVAKTAGAKDGADKADHAKKDGAGEAEAKKDGADADKAKKDGAGKADEAKRDGAGRGEAKKDGSGRDGGQRNQGGQQGGQRNQGQQGNQRQGGGGGGGEEPEPGNRRRRRRGRDRQGQGQGQGQGGPAEEPWQGEPVPVEGLLDLRDEGYGFLRLKGYLPAKEDAYVSVKQVRQFSLRKGDFVKGSSRPASRNEKNPALLHIDEVNGVSPEEAKKRPRFEDLTPLFPDDKLRLEMDDDPGNMTARIIDLLSPIGKGQRGLIVSPPKAGKTTVMKQIARSIETNNPEVHLIVLLVEERPEEVTDMKRWVKSGEVAASTFDRPSDEHTQVAELTIERAKRMVEEGKDVVIILDGITRLARAYNLAAPATGRIMSGGIDTGALYPPRKFFGAARNLEEGGSLTILATALVETGSRMDEVIFEEFKGTGNMELRLDRKMADRRIYPAIDVDASSTRHEELLFERKQLQQVWKLRRVLSGLGEGGGGGGAGLELLIDRMKTFKSNDEFLAEVAKAPSIAG